MADIPVAFCWKEDKSVVVEVMQPDRSNGYELIVYCPSCDTILNNNFEEIKVELYNPADIDFK